MRCPALQACRRVFFLFFRPAGAPPLAVHVTYKDKGRVGKKSYLSGWCDHVWSCMHLGTCGSKGIPLLDLLPGKVLAIRQCYGIGRAATMKFRRGPLQCVLVA